MIKYVVVLVLVWIANSSIAQENDGKRPSWSQGLPERKQGPSIDLVAPKLSLEVQSERPLEFAFPLQEDQAENTSNDPVAVSNHIENTVGEADVNQKEEGNIGGETEDGLQNKLPMTKAPVPAQLLATPSPNSIIDAEADKNETIKSMGYDWQVQRMIPVTVPRTLVQAHRNVLLKIAIDHKGRVVDVMPVVDNTSKAVIRHATRFIKQWRFEPPLSKGINHGLSRVFKVELSAQS